MQLGTLKPGPKEGQLYWRVGKLDPGKQGIKELTDRGSKENGLQGALEASQLEALKPVSLGARAPRRQGMLASRDRLNE